MAITRISMTIPDNLVSALGRKAKELDRSRSWVIAEAVRRFLEVPPAAGRAVAALREPAAPAYAAADVAAARLHHLRSDLALPPTKRLKQAEELASLARSRRRRKGTRHQVIGFDSYEDYYEWKKARRAGA